MNEFPAVMGQRAKDMPQRVAVSRFETPPVDPSPKKCAAQHLATMMRTGSCPNDRSFDRFLPEPLRLVAPEYWTPLVVVKRAADWLEEVGIRTLVDIGSGAGKFCVAGALFGTCRFIGLERCSSLVMSAVALAALFDLNDRVSFVAGALGAVPTPVGDAYYFFNPFGDYWLEPDYPPDVDANAAETRYAEDVAVAEDLLRSVPAGTWILTYNGFGGRMPASYELVRVDRKLGCVLRLWRKRRDTARIHSPRTMQRWSRARLALASKPHVPPVFVRTPCQAPLNRGRVGPPTLRNEPSLEHEHGKSDGADRIRVETLERDAVIAPGRG